MEKKKRLAGSIYRAGGMRKGRRNSNGRTVAERAAGGDCDSCEEKIGDGRYVEPVTCNYFKVTWATGGGCDSPERKIGDRWYVVPVTCYHFKVT